MFIHWYNCAVHIIHSDLLHYACYMIFFILYIQLLVSMFGASIHRRHLMVWAVFGPRFLYEGAFQATTDVCVILVYTILQGLEKHFVD